VKPRVFVDIMTQTLRVLADPGDFLLNRLKTVDASGGCRYFRPGHIPVNNGIRETIRRRSRSPSSWLTGGPISPVTLRMRGNIDDDAFYLAK
jgi:hypothetical protein